MDVRPTVRDFDPYRVLNVSRDADGPAIDRAWASCLKKAQKNAWPYRVEDVNRARAVLKDPKARAEWDLEHAVFPLEPLPDPFEEISAEALGLPLVPPPLGPEFDEVGAELPEPREILVRFCSLPLQLEQLLDPRVFLDTALQELQVDDPWEAEEGALQP